MKKLKVRFEHDGKLRGIICIVAVLMTFLNMWLICNYFEAKNCIQPRYSDISEFWMFLIILTGLLTLVLYHISGGLSKLIGLTLVVAKAAAAIAAFFAVGTAWALGLGGVFVAMIELIVLVAAGIYGAMVVYAIPGLIIPVQCIICSKTGIYTDDWNLETTYGSQEAAAAPDDAAENIRWNAIYNKAVADTKSGRQ